MEGMYIRRAEAADQFLAIEHLRRTGEKIGGIGADSLYPILFVSPEIITVVARTDGAFVGIVLAEVNRKWLWRRPHLLIRMATVRFLRLLRSRTADTVKQAPVLPSFVLRQIPPLSWDDLFPKVLFISVDTNWRGRGIARELYLRMFEEVRMIGQSYILARISRDNTSSLHLHRATGWDLYEDGDVVLAVKTLAASGEQVGVEENSGA